jgi:hypothetical protein
MRIIIAGLLGAIAMFVWTAIAHMATPLAQIGISKMSDEPVVLEAMKRGVEAHSGLYLFPWVDPNDPQMMEKEAALTKTNPSGLLIYHPPGRSTDMGPMLIKEFGKELAQSLLAAFLLSLTVLSGYLARVGFVSLIGLFAVLGSDASYCIWYGFPRDYTMAVMTIELVGAIVAGLVIAALVRPRRA